MLCNREKFVNTSLHTGCASPFIPPSFFLLENFPPISKILFWLAFKHFSTIPPFKMGLGNLFSASKTVSQLNQARNQRLNRLNRRKQNRHAEMYMEHKANKHTFVGGLPAFLSEDGSNRLSALEMSFYLKKYDQNLIKTSMACLYAEIHDASTKQLARILAKFLEYLNGETPGVKQKQWVPFPSALETIEIFKTIEYTVLAARQVNTKDSVSIGQSAPSPLILANDEEVYSIDDLSKQETLRSMRYNNLALTSGWMMLGILAHSKTFRNCASTMETYVWRTFVTAIRQNRNSIECFAKVRGLDWQTGLIRIPDYADLIGKNLRERYPNISPSHPHTLVVPRKQQPLRHPRYNGHNQDIIRNSTFSFVDFEGCRVQPGCPSGNPFPSDPSLTAEDCDLCESAGCDCMTSEKITKPFIEIREYGIKGLGIRTLQHIYKGDILDEYVGQLRPLNRAVSNVYSMALLVNRSDLVLIDSQREGNWTRFVNHSCNPSAGFRQLVIGGRRRVMIEAVRDIQIFEELTVHYGPDYWTGQEQLCRCGAAVCISKKQLGK